MKAMRASIHFFLLYLAISILLKSIMEKLSTQYIYRILVKFRYIIEKYYVMASF